MADLPHIAKRVPLSRNLQLQRRCRWVKRAGSLGRRPYHGPHGLSCWTQDEPTDLNLRTRFTDVDEVPGTIRMSAMPASAKPPAPLKALELDLLTVADDEGYFAALSRQRNVPQAIMNELTS